METEASGCSIGIALEEECNKKIYSRNVGILAASDLSQDDKKLLEWRSEVLLREDSTVCFHHEKMYLSKYKNTQRYCSDPFKLHKKRISSLLSLLSSCESGLLGDKECTYGPAFWCESIKNAKQCSAVKHCIQTVWENQVLPEDNDDVCAICKEMVNEAREVLVSNETQEEIREVFEGSCKLIPITLVRDECIKFSDEFIPELIDTLASQMNPQVVCATAGLCNSAKVDRLIKQYKEKNGDISFAPAPRTPLPGDCKDCKTFITDVVNIVRRHSRAELLDHLLAICGRLGTLSDGCMALVQSNFQDIYNFLTRGLNPNDVCLLFGMCEGLYGDQRVSLTKTGDEPCDFCVAIVTTWRNNLISNTTKDEFKMILDGICHQMGSFEKECFSLVDQYFEALYDILVSEIQPEEICEAVGLCGATALFKNDVPVWTVLQLHPKDKLPLAPLRPSFDQHSLIGQDEANSYRHNIHLPRVPLVSPSVHVVSLGRKGFIPQNFVEKSDECVMCEFTLHFIQNLLSDKKTRQEIEDAVESVCQYMPKSVVEMCEDYIEAYGDQVIQMLILELDPATICPELNLCPSDDDVVDEVALSPVGDTSCVLCEYVMTELDQILEDTSNEEAIKAALDNVCSLMPKSIRTDCKGLIDTYIDQIIDLIVNDVTPEQLCQALGICPAQSPPSLSAIDPAEAQLPFNRMLVDDPWTRKEMAKMALFKPGYQSPQCIICEFIMTEIDSLLLNNSTEEEIKNTVAKVCVILPATLMNDCLSFMQEYGDSVIELLVNSIEPDVVCRNLRICTDRYHLGLPKAVINSPINKCLVCEEVMELVSGNAHFKGSQEDINKIRVDLCMALTKNAEEECSKMVLNYGPYLGELLLQLRENKLVCQALKMCPRLSDTMYHGDQMFN